jgi:hypothetical protein
VFALIFFKIKTSITKFCGVQESFFYIQNLFSWQIKATYDLNGTLGTRWQKTFGFHFHKYRLLWGSNVHSHDVYCFMYMMPFFIAYIVLLLLLFYTCIKILISFYSTYICFYTKGLDSHAQCSITLYNIWL